MSETEIKTMAEFLATYDHIRLNLRLSGSVVECPLTKPCQLRRRVECKDAPGPQSDSLALCASAVPCNSGKSRRIAVW